MSNGMNVLGLIGQMGYGMSILGLGLAISLALVHLLAGRSKWIAQLPQNLWTSFAGGVSISYIFLNVFPELTEAQTEIEASGNVIVSYFEHHVYLLSLIGLLLFYGLEKVVIKSRAHNKEMTGDNVPEPGIFWTHIAFVAIYNAILGYLFRESAVHGIRECIILFFALGLHFLVNDVGLRHYHRKAYDQIGRWVLAGAIVTGWCVGQVTDFNEAAIAAIWALIAGSIIFNVLKEEMPDSPDSHFGFFTVGLVAYAIILSF
ncbi:MAG: hypothetical protein AAGN15_11320 [Cyanobacteria bacterium J06581_3]